MTKEERSLTLQLMCSWLFCVVAGSACGPPSEEGEVTTRRILLVIENISDAEQTYKDAQGVALPIAFAPGVYGVQREGVKSNPIFTPGASASPELEALAERSGARRSATPIFLRPATLVGQ